MGCIQDVDRSKFLCECEIQSETSVYNNSEDEQFLQEFINEEPKKKLSSDSEKEIKSILINSEKRGSLKNNQSTLESASCSPISFKQKGNFAELENINDNNLLGDPKKTVDNSLSSHSNIPNNELFGNVKQRKHVRFTHDYCDCGEYNAYRNDEDNVDYCGNKFCREIFENKQTCTLGEYDLQKNCIDSLEMKYIIRTVPYTNPSVQFQCSSYKIIDNKHRKQQQQLQQQ